MEKVVESLQIGQTFRAAIPWLKQDIVARRLLIARRYATVVLDAVEKPLRLVVVHLKMANYLPWLFAVVTRRNDGFCLPRFHERNKGSAIVTLVGDDHRNRVETSGPGCNQRFGLRDIGMLSRGQGEAKRVTRCIDRRLKLRREAVDASGPRLRLRGAFFDRRRADGRAPWSRQS